MVHARPLFALCGLLAFCSLAVPRANADPFTQTGSFTDDNEVLQIPFSTTTTQTYNFYTTSYSGGVNANGTTTMAGGFDPILSLFNGNGTIFTGDASSNGGSDANLIDVLNPGSYILVLTEFPNYSSGTIASFTFPGNPPSTNFIDLVTGNPTTANYAVNYTSAAVSAVTPEPPSALLVLLPLAGVVVLNRRRLASIASL